MCLILASLLLAGCASAPVAHPPLADVAPTDGGIELTQAICMHGIFGFHFKTEGPSEGNAYMPLRMLAALCRKGEDSDDKPQGVERL